MPRKEHHTTPTIIGHSLYTDLVAVSRATPAWCDWLAQHTTFYLDSPLGTFTARREPRSGAVFWYAFRRYHKRLYKVYLSRSADLTIARLLTVAPQVAEQAGA